MSPHTAIVWLREDLRLADNQALQHAASHFKHIVAVYLHCPNEAGEWTSGAASRWWLHHSLVELQQRLEKRGSPLVIRMGDSSQILLDELVSETSAKAVFWNRMYTPWAIERDKRIKQTLRGQGIETYSFNAALLHEPWEVLKQDGNPYKVFTAWWRRNIEIGLKQDIAATPRKLPGLKKKISSRKPEELELLPDIAWDRGFYDHWHPGELGGQKNLKHFIKSALVDYSDNRNLPGTDGTSRLSPHLHFGEISPRQIIQALYDVESFEPDPKGPSPLQRYSTEIGWREFGYYLLYHFPRTTNTPMSNRFRHFPWINPKSSEYKNNLAAWQQGQTGIPIVDAGMRELWHCGWMHNRVRMIVASFLTKNLLIPWQDGAKWFWDTLVDADLASNSMGWQWVAGSGADAAPYFRIFNPVTQGEKFDPEGHYVRRWVPELADLNNKCIHQPWRCERPPKDYPAPIADLKTTRERALQAYKNLR